MTDNIIANVGFKIDNQAFEKLNKQLDEMDKKLKASTSSFKTIEKEAKKSADKIASDYNKLGITMGKAIGGAIATAAIAGFALLIKNTIDASNEMAAFESIVISTGQRAGYTAKQLADLGQSTADVFGIDAGDVNGAIVAILGYSKIVGSEVPRALQAAIDYTARYGGALDENARKIALAYENPLRAMQLLERQGMSLSNSQKEQIKSFTDQGNNVAAAGVILDKYAESTKGAADALRDTLPGAVKALALAFNDLIEFQEDGTGATEDFKDATNQLTNLLQQESTRKSMQDFIGWFVTLGVELTTGAVLLVDYAAKLNNVFELRKRNAQQESQDTKALEDRQQAVFNTLTRIQSSGFKNSRLVEVYRPDTVLTFNRSLMSQEELVRSLKTEYLELDKRIVKVNTANAASTQTTNAQVAASNGISTSIQENIDKLNGQTEAMGKNKVQLAELSRQRQLAVAVTQGEKDAINASYDAHIKAIKATEASTTASKAGAAATRASAKSQEDAAKAAKDYADSLQNVYDTINKRAINNSTDSNNQNLIDGARLSAQYQGIFSSAPGSRENSQATLINVQNIENGIKLVEEFGGKVRLIKEEFEGGFKLTPTFDISGITDQIKGFSEQSQEAQDEVTASLLISVDKAFKLGEAYAHNAQQLGKLTQELAIGEQYVVNTRVNEEAIAGIKNGTLRTAEQITRFMQQQEFLERLRTQAAKDGLQVDEEKLKKQYDAYIVSQEQLAREQQRVQEINTTIADVGNLLSNSLLEGLETGRLDFKKFIYDLGTYLIQSNIKKIFASLFDTTSTSGSGGTNWLGIISSVVGIFTGGGNAASAAAASSGNYGAFNPNMKFANGGAFDNGIQFFADGGVVNRATGFNMAGGQRGVMGESGPEGILPLSRGNGGKLGVNASGMGGTEVNNNYQLNSTINVQSTDNAQRDDEQTAKAIKKMLKNEFNAMIADAQRSGGALNPKMRSY